MTGQNTSLNEVALKLLKKELPDNNEKDILNLIDNLKAISNQKREEYYSQNCITPGALDQWLPGQQTVKEILSKQVCVDDLKHCIEDFRHFARSKGWGIKDNLDAKLVGHIKIMIQGNKIKLRESIRP